jgi:hypothetical protein
MRPMDWSYFYGGSMKEKQPNQKQVFVAELQLFSFFLERFFKKQVSLKRIIKELEKLHELAQQIQEESNQSRQKTRGKKV